MRSILIFISICFSLLFKSQITFIGHCYINNEKLANTEILVNNGSDVIQKLNTNKTNDFSIKLEFGNIYRLHLKNELSPNLILEIVANNIPDEKKNIHMTHEMNIEFYYTNDDDIDTSVFKRPFKKLIFDGKSKIVEDTAYTAAFERKILRQIPLVEEARDPKGLEFPVTIAGRLVLNEDIKLPLSYKKVSIFNKENKILKRTETNRFGSFAFTGVKYSQISKIRIETASKEISGGEAHVLNSKHESVASSKCAGEGCYINLNSEKTKSLIDNNYTANIGGKLILSSPGSKKFFSNKTVYLSNKRNTVIQKTTTNILGTFVFEGLKPDASYYIGIDAKEASPGENIDFLNKDDKLVAQFDTVAAFRRSIKLSTDFNPTFNAISISDDEMKMNVRAKLYGDNTNNPIGKLKILLLNDAYVVIDSALTDDFGTFKFKYLPFLKKFYLSAENTNNILDVFNNILVYSIDDNLLKVMTHEKGTKFEYRPIPAEMNKLKEIEIDDPWFELITNDKERKTKRGLDQKKTIIENILFNNNEHELLPQAKQILDKVILVLKTNKSIKLELSAHTDSKGNDADNLKLSQLRAKSVREYITKAGIEIDRIISVGYGEGQLLNKCSNNVPCTELEHAQNRRVEFKILEE
ncbi:MAG: OmpA family protein [Sphingobacteriaceae bacterium]|nr:OmpA family protein [Sphingobacteriaceae bacterium]